MSKILKEAVKKVVAEKNARIELPKATAEILQAVSLQLMQAEKALLEKRTEAGRLMQAIAAQAGVDPEKYDFDPQAGCFVRKPEKKAG